uniref:NADH-ubiquinone oxidoreductase chain 5 n=1 Tax=Phellinotus piptadeniae TaxID=1638731 RepID=A0A8A5M8P4_9AGAM|nr:NADH dehydrogenase subunit 5 [Phellinotus piptadeniae]QTF87865.1 NADH dehydrogenase subunit 5 [Phellinotus piptadeniae]
MYLSILILPFLGSLVSGLMGRKIGVSGAHFITCTCLLLSSLLATIAFYEVGICGSPVSINLISWVESEFMSISWEFLFDQLTVYLLALYLTVEHNQRFFSYLSLFTFFMILLASGANYFVMFVGDMGLSIGFFALFAMFGSLDYSTIFSLAPIMNETAITVISLLLFMGAMAKSAQLGLHSWLPGSMEAPTPVSALLHAATLVTAGLYLLVRSSPLLEFSPTALLVITLLGASTAFFAATCGLVLNDIKRIVAFSTISQLGYMVMAVGISQYNVALMHVVNHAFFKALLFLGAGAIIHSAADEQDIRKLGGLIKILPFIYSAMLVGTIALLGLPWLSGFYSKDLIIELAYSQYSFSSTYAYVLGSITAGLTSFYSFRLISLVFLTAPNGPRVVYSKLHEAKLAVIIPLLALSLFSIFFGFIFSDLFVGIGTDFFGNAIYIHPNNNSLVEAEFSINTGLKLLPSILSIIGGLLAIYLYHLSPNIINNLSESSLFRKIYSFLNGQYYFDLIYNQYIINKGLYLGYKISNVLDRGIIETVGPHGISTVLKNTGENIAKLDTGIITTYALYITLGLLTLLFLIFSPILIDSTNILPSTSTFLGIDVFKLMIVYFTSLIFILW